MIRVLITDDSPTARHLLTHILNSAPDIQVVGEAVNGAEAVHLAHALKPDLILMDIHMPVLDGLAATREIMTRTPLPIVLISASTMVNETESAMLALRAGALTLLLKPTGPNDPDHDRASSDLVDTVRAMADVKVVRHHHRFNELDAIPISPRPARKTPVSICAVATSTGGPPAMLKIFSELPAEFPVPILVVQHIAAGFTEGLVTWLNSCVPLTVKIAESGERLCPGTVYVAREDRHLAVSRDRTIVLSESAAIDGFRPSGTFLFRSVAEVYGNRTLALILTGMGHDGVAGLRDVRRAGGTIFAQDEESCVVFGMPGSAVAEKLADRVLPLDFMARAILARTTDNNPISS